MLFKPLRQCLSLTKTVLPCPCRCSASGTTQRTIRSATLVATRCLFAAFPLPLHWLLTGFSLPFFPLSLPTAFPLPSHCLLPVSPCLHCLSTATQVGDKATRESNNGRRDMVFSESARAAWEHPRAVDYGESSRRVAALRSVANPIAAC